jgi:hypothetical protein
MFSFKLEEEIDFITSGDREIRMLFFSTGFQYSLFNGSVSSPEMEFLDINLTKDSSLLLHAIHSPYYWWM